MRVIRRGDDEWPSMLDDLGEEFRDQLWVEGSCSLGHTLERSIAIVGVGASSAYGDHIAADWAYDLAADGGAVVSGAAACGIDASAHRGALASGGATIAVLPCGLNTPYPQPHRSLLQRIAEQGVVVSPYPPGTPPTRQRLLDRNEIIAALGHGTVLVEAGLRSGSVNTARHARRLGRPVMAVPGAITSSLSAGCHDLIKSGDAALVASTEDVRNTVWGPRGDEP